MTVFIFPFFVGSGIPSWSLLVFRVDPGLLKTRFNKVEVENAALDYNSKKVAFAPSNLLMESPELGVKILRQSERSLHYKIFPNAVHLMREGWIKIEFLQTFFFKLFIRKFRTSSKPPILAGSVDVVL